MLLSPSYCWSRNNPSASWANRVKSFIRESKLNVSIWQTELHTELKSNKTLFQSYKYISHNTKYLSTAYATCITNNSNLLCTYMYIIMQCGCIIYLHMTPGHADIMKLEVSQLKLCKWCLMITKVEIHFGEHF